MANIKNTLLKGINICKELNHKMPAEILIHYDQFDILLSDYFKFLNVEHGPLIEYKFMGIHLVPTDTVDVYKIKMRR